MSTSLRELNEADQDAFVAAVGFVFEGSPHFAARAWYARPFARVDDLHRALVAAVEDAPQSAQLALIQAHPDLAGKAAIGGTLTAESTREQASAGLNRLSPEEFARFTALNASYRERFGFPFIVCVREHTKESILAGFESRLQHRREQEIATALVEIGKIARLRLSDVVRPS